MTYRPNKMQKGSHAFSYASSTVTQPTITFPVAFNSIPTVIAVLRTTENDVPYATSGGLYETVIYQVSNISTTGFTVKVRAAQNSNANGYIDWIAWG